VFLVSPASLILHVVLISLYSGSTCKQGEAEGVVILLVPTHSSVAQHRLSARRMTPRTTYKRL
jgi:hypothetical protein